jgi:hypothetical protein
MEAIKLDRTKPIIQQDPDPSDVVQILTDAVKLIIDSLGNKVSYKLEPGEILKAGKWFSTVDVKTHETYRLELTVKIPVQ